MLQAKALCRTELILSDFPTLNRPTKSLLEIYAPVKNTFQSYRLFPQGCFMTLAPLPEGDETYVSGMIMRFITTDPKLIIFYDRLLYYN